MSETERLIEMVKVNPILYDFTHKDFSDLKQRDEIWDEIGLAIGHEGYIVKKKWKNLRDCYAKYLRSIKADSASSKTDCWSSSTVSAKRYKNWQWASQMEAFKPYIGYPKSKVNLMLKKALQEDARAIDENLLNVSEENFDDKESQANGLSPKWANQVEVLMDVPKTKTEKDVSIDEQLFNINFDINETNSKIKKRKMKSSSQDYSSIDNQMKDYISKSNSLNLDATEMIFLGYAKTIKTFSPRRQTMLKMKIASLIMEEELEDQEEAKAAYN